MRQPWPDCQVEHQPDEDDLGFARLVLGGTENEVYDLAVTRADVRCTEDPCASRQDPWATV